MTLDIPSDHFWMVFNYRGVLMTTCKTEEEARTKAARWSKGGHRLGPEVVTILEAKKVDSYYAEKPRVVELNPVQI